MTEERRKLIQDKQYEISTIKLLFESKGDLRFPPYVFNDYDAELKLTSKTASSNVMFQYVLLL